MSSSFLTGLVGGATPGVRKMRKKLSSKGGGDGDGDNGSSSGSGTGGGNVEGSYKRGGKVRKTGRAKVHRGERVLTAKQAKRYERKRGSKR